MIGYTDTMDDSEGYIASEAKQKYPYTVKTEKGDKNIVKTVTTKSLEKQFKINGNDSDISDIKFQGSDYVSDS